MTQNETCSTCHCWCRFESTDKMGTCVFHTGIKGAPLAKIKFGGTLKTVPEFGCRCWELDQRKSVQSQAEGE